MKNEAAGIKTVKTVPDGAAHKNAWIVTVSAVIGAIAIAIAQKKLMPCIEIVQADFGIDKSAAGLLSSIFCIMGIVMAVPGAFIVKKLGERRTCLLSLAFAAGGAGIGLLADSYALLLVSRIVEGIGVGLISVAVPQIIALCFPPEKRGTPTGLWSSWQFVASAFVFLTGSALAEKHGWHGVWILSLVITAVCLVISMFLTRPPETERVLTEGEKESLLKSFAGVLSNRGAWLLSLAMFCYCFCYLAQTTWLASFWNEQAGLETGYANRLISYSSILAIPVTLFSGALLDRLNRRRVCALGSLVYALFMVLGFTVRSQAGIWTLVIAKPFAEGAVSTSLWTMIPLSARKASEKVWVIALFNLLSNLAMLVSSPLTGALVTGMGWMGCGAVLCGVSLAGAGAVAAVKMPGVTG